MYGFLSTLLFIMGTYLHKPVDAFQPALINGNLIDNFTFPELVYVKNHEGARCSGTVVGPHAILTAAHCIDEQGQIENVYSGPSFLSFTAQCTVHPQYLETGSEMDMAICKTEQELDVIPASISKNSVKLGQQVLLSGFGCTQSNATGGNDGTLRVGHAIVTELHQSLFPWFVTTGGSAICFGDSGGPAFKDMEPGETRHVVLGVNSRGDIHTTSLLTPIYSQKSRKFLRQWAKKNRVEICGLTNSCFG